MIPRPIVSPTPTREEAIAHTSQALDRISALCNRNVAEKRKRREDEKIEKIKPWYLKD